MFLPLACWSSYHYMHGKNATTLLSAQVGRLGHEALVDELLKLFPGGFRHEPEADPVANRGMYIDLEESDSESDSEDDESDELAEPAEDADAADAVVPAADVTGTTGAAGKRARSSRPTAQRATAGRRLPLPALPCRGSAARA